jgi:4-amino-4-deoxy-L-arabinose transferase-like glycosyltransferase
MLKVYRLSALLLTLAAAVLFTLGLFDTHAGHERNLFAGSFLATLVAATACILWRMETVFGKVFAREATRSRKLLAEGIAEALADELEARRNPPPRLTSVR